MPIFADALNKILKVVGWQIIRAPIRARTVDKAPGRSPTPSESDVQKYWIGSTVNYKELWAAYEAGEGYIYKFKKMECHLLVIEFHKWNRSFPLFDHEAVFKTIKGLFHDLKKENLSPAEYDAAGPLFFYSVERGSSIYKFLGELRQILMLGNTLSDEKLKEKHLRNMQERIDFMRKNFTTVEKEAAQQLVLAKTTDEMDEAVKKLMECGIKSIKVSQQAVLGAPNQSEVKLIELKLPEIDEKK
jgi:hypothetical protein